MIVGHLLVAMSSASPASSSSTAFTVIITAEDEAIAHSLSVLVNRNDALTTSALVLLSLSWPSTLAAWCTRRRAAI